MMNPGKPLQQHHPQQPRHSPFALYTLSASRHRPRNVPISRKGIYYRAAVCGMAILSLMLVANWAAYLSSPTFLTVENMNTPSFLIPPFILDDGEPHHLQVHHREPWIGDHALIPPLTQKPNTTKYHVRIIIRVHHEQKGLVHGLIHSLRHQQQLLASPTLSMDFALVPTELPGVSVAQEVARDFWSNPLDPFPHVYAVNLDQSFFVAAKDRAAPLKCTSTEASEIARKHNKNSVRKVCHYDNHVYYQATDVAVRDLLEGCHWCTHMLVTNSDNGYHPDFFRETLLSIPRPLKEGDQPSKKEILGKFSKERGKNKEGVLTAIEERGWDVVTTDFTTSGYRISARYMLGRLDLGSVLFSKEIVGKVGGFIAALPPEARALDAHNADWLFTEKAMTMNGLATVVNKLLFFHN